VGVTIEHEAPPSMAVTSSGRPICVVVFPVWIGMGLRPAYLFGDFHDWGGLPILIGEAPVVLLRVFFDLISRTAPWVGCFVIILDWIYFVFLVTLFVAFSAPPFQYER